MSFPPTASNTIICQGAKKWTNFGFVCDQFNRCFIELTLQKYARVAAYWGPAAFLAAMFFGQPRLYLRSFFAYVPPPIGPYFWRYYDPAPKYLNPILQ
jgi:hypothetical protein